MLSKQMIQKKTCHTKCHFYNLMHSFFIMMINRYIVSLTCKQSYLPLVVSILGKHFIVEKLLMPDSHTEFPQEL